MTYDEPQKPLSSWKAFTRNIPSWLKITLTASVIAFVTIKLALADLSALLKNSDFSDLLALVLGLFAIVMSTMFYFKATDTSNEFYNNTYKFTKDVSEILGRIEAGFGERLRHLDEGYTGMLTHLRRTDPEVIQQEIDDKTKEQEEQGAEKQQMIDELATKAQLNAAERDVVKSRLQEMERREALAHYELEDLKKQLEYARSLSEVKEMNENAIAFIVNTIGARQLITSSPKQVVRIARKAFRALPRTDQTNMVERSIFTSDGVLTEFGIRLLRDWIDSKDPRQTPGLFPD